MGINGTYSANTQLTGPGLGPVPQIVDTQQTTPTTVNAPMPDTFGLIAGATTICQVPDTSYTFTRCQLMPIGSAPSTNLKTVYGVSTVGVIDTTGLGGWTAGSITIPVVPGGAFAVSSTANEKLYAVYS